MSQKTPETVSAAVAHTLTHNNLLRVFSNRDPVSRREVIKETYHPDVVLLEPDDIAHGHDGVDAKAQALLDERQGWEFVPDGPVRQNHEMLHLAWGFGPKGADGKVDVKAKGSDTLIVRDGKVERFWVIIEGVSDVKV